MEFSPRKQKICIIEDEPFIQEIYKKALENSDYEVCSAFNGKEGLELLKKEMPDLALIDLIMPEMDGIELMKIRQNDPELSKIPVIILSNVNDDKTLKQIGEFQTDFYLVKSMYDPKKVVGVIKEVLHHRKKI